jgi:hypothetical protein
MILLKLLNVLPVLLFAWSIPIYKDVMMRLWCFSKYVSVFIFFNYCLVNF